MKIIKAPNLARAQELAVKSVLQTGYIIDDTIESESLCLIIADPVSEPRNSSCSRIRRQFMDLYSEALMHSNAHGFEYDYHSRLFHWGGGLEGDFGEEINVDQIKYVILDKLGENPNSRRAIATTWIPYIDGNREDVPCLQLVQCLIRNDRLCMKVVFRSNDILTALGANMYALTNLQKYIADTLKIPVGSYEHVALVPHIYYKRDASDIVEYCAIGRSFVPCTEVCNNCEGIKFKFKDVLERCEHKL